jgi:hypothetical protein
MNSKMLVSAHMDKEVEAPWDAQVEQLITSNPSWAEQAAVHRGVKEVLARDKQPDPGPSQALVWSRLRAVQAAPKVLRTPAVSWWSLPAAAAVLALVLGAGYWMGSHNAGTGTNLAELEVQVPTQFHLQLSGEGQLLKVSTMEGGTP